MDVIFNCPKCDQELAVDSSGVGTQIECPSCGEDIIIPAPGPGVRTSAGGASGPEIVNPINTSAAAKVHLHLKVQQHKSPSASLIEKPAVPLEFAAKETDKKIKVKTIKHTDCIEVGHDKFDEVVSSFLGKVGESNIVNISPMTYTHLDIGSQKLMTDFAVMIIYRG